MKTIDIHDQSSFTPTQVADFLGMKTSSIYALISRGYLSANRVGTRRLVTTSQLNQYLLNRRSGDQVIDLNKPRTLLSDNTTLQGTENQILDMEIERGWKQWQNTK